MDSGSLASQMLALFRTESIEGLELLTAALADNLPVIDASERVDTVFRVLHSLRGSAAMNGLDEVSALAGLLEVRLDALRRTGNDIDDHTRTHVLTAADLFAAWLIAPGAPDPAIVRATRDLQDLLTAMAPVDETTRSPTVTGPSVPWQVWSLKFAPGEQLMRRGVDVLGLIDELSCLGMLALVPDLERLPPLDALIPDAVYLGWRMLLLTQADSEAVRDVFLFVEDDSEVSLQCLADDVADDWEWNDAAVRALLSARQEPTADAMRNALFSRAAGGRAIDSTVPFGPEVTTDDDTHVPVVVPVPTTLSGTVPVPSGRLDRQVDLVGELVIAQSALMQIADTLRNPALSNAVDQVMRLTTHMRDNAMHMRMMPVAPWLTGLAEDLDSRSGGTALLQTRGGETELDMAILLGLRIPVERLLHSLADRDRDQGRRCDLAIDATTAGDEVLFHIEDRFATDSEETQETRSLRIAVNALRGSLSSTWSAVQGARFTLGFPLARGIIDGLLVAVHGQRFVLPLASVKEILDMNTVHGANGHGQDILNLRGRVLPFVRLNRLFDLDDRNEAISGGHAVVVQVSDERSVAVVVDRVIGQHQTVIKPVSTMCGDATMLSGSTILGDGTVALILDVTALLHGCEANEGETIS